MGSLRVPDLGETMSLHTADLKSENEHEDFLWRRSGAPIWRWSFVDLKGVGDVLPANQIAQSLIS